MIKLRLNSPVSFKLVEKKAKRISSNNKKVSKTIRGVCIKEGNKYFIEISKEVLKTIPEFKNTKENIKFEFTKESYNLKGITHIFLNKPAKDGKYLQVIRTEDKAKLFPGDPNNYIPFYPKWICTGHIVKKEMKYLFEFKECIMPEGCIPAEAHNED